MKKTFEIPEGCNRVTIEQHEDKFFTIFETPIKESFMDKIVTINANCTGIKFKEDNPEWNAETKQIEEIKPKRWRAEKGCNYFYINPCGLIVSCLDYYFPDENKKYHLGNYFKTEKHAEAAAEKIKELLKQINP